MSRSTKYDYAARNGPDTALSDQTLVAENWL
jgi:hypothetical protein